MQSNSKSIWASKLISEDDLIKLASKYTISNFSKPLNEQLRELLTQLLVIESRSIIIDAGCGIGESSFKLALQNPESLVLGIDKSISRLDRKNAFKKELPANVVFIHCDLLDFYPIYLKLVEEYSLVTKKQYFLYPNPWPKLKSIKKRFHASPILPFIMNLRSPIEIRSNWDRYLEEFFIVSDKLFARKCKLESIDTEDKWMTPFEKKYQLSGQKIYKLEVLL